MKLKSRNIIFIAITLLALFVIVEMSAYLLLNFSILKNYTYPYFNRELSGYSLYKNSSGFEYENSIKRHEEETNPIINKFGFISGEELKYEKDSSEFRIFILGGSGAFGNGQSVPYNKVKDYPRTLYSFESSISGLLEKKLQNYNPDRKFVVVNACASGRMLNQSIGLYLENIKNFQPDVIISIDGMNDITTMTGESPYNVSDLQLDYYANLYNLSKKLQQKSISNFVNLIRKLKLYRIEKNVSKNLESNSEYLLQYNAKDYPKSDYEIYKTDWISKSNVFTDLILEFNAVCKVHNCDFVFCLQPLLNRKINKDLTPTEILMQQSVNPINLALSGNTLEKNKLEKFENLGNLTLMYFIDDYLSSQIDHLSQENDFYFLDLNQKMENDYGDKDFFVDYCHLTHDGNEFVSQILFEKIVQIINIRN